MACGGTPIGSVDFQATATTANATGGLAVKALTASKRIYITDIVISTDTAMNIEGRDTASAVLFEHMYFPANSIWSKTWTTPIQTAVGVGFNVIASTAGNVTCTITGFIK